MRTRTVYIITILAIFTSMLALGCSRELRGENEEPWRPFSFDKIPVLDEPPQDAPPEVQGSVAETEPVESGDPEEMVVPEETELDPQVAALMDEGREALATGEYEMAVEKFTRVLENSPDNPRALYNLALAYRRIGNWDRAIEYASRAVEADPDLLFVHQNLGYAYEGQGDIDSAIGEYEREILTHPDETRLAGLSAKLAEIYISRDLHQEAFDAAIRAMNLEPDQPSHLYTLARVHQKNGAFDQAIESMQQALELAPSNVSYMVYLADILWDAERPDEAREMYGQAIELEPGLVDEIDPERLPQVEASEPESPGAPSDEPL